MSVKPGEENIIEGVGTLQALYDSEINCRFESFWDDGWIGWLGDELNGFRFAKVRGRTFDDCAVELGHQACAVYPASTFAERYRAALQQ